MFFRDSARRQANELGVTGFARNEPDGTVYIEAEGDEKTLEKFLVWCRQGPAQAKVEKVKTVADKIKHFSGFSDGATDFH